MDRNRNRPELVLWRGLRYNWPRATYSGYNFYTACNIFLKKGGSITLLQVKHHHNSEKTFKVIRTHCAHYFIRGAISQMISFSELRKIWVWIEDAGVCTTPGLCNTMKYISCNIHIAIWYCDVCD